MTTLGLLVAVAVLLGLFSYFTNAGLGDRRPKDDKPKGHSGDDEPPPSK